MTSTQEIAITGMGVVSPIGIGAEPFWASLLAGRSGVRLFPWYDRDHDGLLLPFGGEVADFDAKQYVRPRKSLKVMSRDVQLAFAAADLACRDGGLHSGGIARERLGVIFGADLMTCELPEMANAIRVCTVDGRFDSTRWAPAARAELYPLWLLKYLPNMLACHIGIAQNAHGPNNSLVLGEVSSLAAVMEASRVIARGQADVMIVGGASSRIHPAMWTRGRCVPFSHRDDDPAAACRPFDARRDGLVYGEGAAAFLLESSAHAAARGATVLARILATASAFEPNPRRQPLEGRAIAASIRGALAHAQLTPPEIGHVNAHGVGTRHDDQIEAQAIRATLGDVPVTAPKSFFGNLGAGTGAVEMAASVLALQTGLVPPTLNYQDPDPACAVNVVHGEPLVATRPTALLLNHTPQGQAVAVVLAAADGMRV